MGWGRAGILATPNGKVEGEIQRKKERNVWIQSLATGSPKADTDMRDVSHHDGTPYDTEWV